MKWTLPFAKVVISVLLILIVIAYFYFAYAPVPDEPALTAKIKSNTIQTGILKRAYLAYIPKRLNIKPALIIAMHGTGMNASKMREWTGYEFDEMADKRGFIVVYPDAYKKSWNDCRSNSPFAATKENIDDVSFITKLIDKFKTEYGVDSDKVFLFGFSSGGQMAFRLSIESSQYISAVCAISSALPTPETCSCAQEGKTSRIMLVAGTKDPISPYLGGEVNLFGFKKVGTALSAQQTAENFARRNGIFTNPVRESLFQKGKDEGVECQSWGNAGAPIIQLYTIPGGGHTIPQSRYRFPRIMGKTENEFDGIAKALVFFGLDR